MNESFESTSLPAVEGPPLPVLPDEPVRRPISDVAPEPIVTDVAADEADAPAPADEAAGQSSETKPGSCADPALAELKASIEKLTAEVSRHHDRAAKREEIINSLHAQSERLRVGERRSTIRPLLLAISRVRDDLLRQSRTLPADFDAARAERLLVSFASAVEVTLDDYGVGTFKPRKGEVFDPRRHRAIASLPAPEAALAKTIVEVRRDGYQDIEAGVTLSQAEVAVYTDPVPETPPDSTPCEPPSAPDTQPGESVSID